MILYMSKYKTDFLNTFVLDVLKEHGTGDLTEDQKETFVPFFVLYIQRQIGETLVSKLDDDGLDHITDLLKDHSTSLEEWFNFFNTQIDNIQNEFDSIMEAFKKQIIDIVKEIKSSSKNINNKTYEDIQASITQMEKELRKAQREAVSLRLSVNTIIDRQHIKNVLQNLVEEV